MEFESGENGICFGTYAVILKTFVVCSKFLTVIVGNVRPRVVDIPSFLTDTDE